ncbi:uncharacterized protein MYCFIDRAFT_82450 [Pseudocercospora fijiensis CIRAD86]|uniref:C2H2 type master regulator of conidiophore development brlA n=1 Tax=Pseudocercospora fijiensis (strain CIRAD86) TaxID=383855 RepID=M3A402_PSEFD|nr:uncharacterized protein MYCFIDRAFT_82450 [Pseudocercospora fijiensis CIRAD86]EME85829.1 hypothetical protein MYCFIDRAFT_82450 [Pseudocercospora fijiensis CIRAD86]
MADVAMADHLQADSLLPGPIWRYPNAVQEACLQGHILLIHDMSNTTTPTHPGRGMPVPGIDTKQAASLSFSGWPLTPPQSANESRRPSLAFSSLSDASASGPSSIADFSQPSTPVHSMVQESFAQHWNEGAEVQGRPMNSFSDGCALGQMPPMFQPLYHQSAMGSAPSLEAPVYAHQHNFNAQQSPLRHEAWSSSNQSSLGINTNAPGLRTTLFQNSTGLNQERVSASMYNNPSPTAPSLGQSVFPNYDHGGPVVSPSMFRAPHTVVPSQLSPQEDYPMDSYVPCKVETMGQDFGSSFDSAGTEYSGWEAVGQQSPHDQYFAHSDEDDYVIVKHESLVTPSRTPYRSHRYMQQTSSPDRVRPRSSKRTSKGHAAGKVWAEYEGTYCSVRCEGKPFEFDVDGRIVTQPTIERKPHHCQVVVNGKACGASFERSEHLKRHMGKHTNKRDYPCPLDSCNKAIGRPDNASDHFKTHLKPPGKGKRNKHCDWETLETAILEQYPEKKSTKLLANLRKWMEAENEKAFDEQQELMRR